MRADTDAVARPLAHLKESCHTTIQVTQMQTVTDAVARLLVWGGYD